MKIFLKCLGIVCVASLCVFLITSILNKINHEVEELDSIAFQEQYAAAVKAFNLMQPYLDTEQQNALEQRILELESAGIPARGQFCDDSFASVLQDMVLENCCWAKRKIEPIDNSCEDESEKIEQLLAPVPRETIWQMSWQLNDLHFAIHDKIESFPAIARKETRIKNAISTIDMLFVKTQ